MRSKPGITRSAASNLFRIDKLFYQKKTQRKLEEDEYASRAHILGLEKRKKKWGFFAKMNMNLAGNTTISKKSIQENQKPINEPDIKVNQTHRTYQEIHSFFFTLFPSPFPSLPPLFIFKEKKFLASPSPPFLFYIFKINLHLSGILMRRLEKGSDMIRNQGEERDTVRRH